MKYASTATTDDANKTAAKTEYYSEPSSSATTFFFLPFPEAEDLDFLFFFGVACVSCSSGSSSVSPAASAEALSAAEILSASSGDPLREEDMVPAPPADPPTDGVGEGVDKMFLFVEGDGVART